MGSLVNPSDHLLQLLCNRFPPVIGFVRTSAARDDRRQSAGSTCTLPLLRDCGWRR